jgi:hypothetical protein
MGKRHRSEDLVPAPKADARAHARGERHRVHTELHGVAGLVSNGLEPDDVMEPGPAWRPESHHEPERALRRRGRARLRHWKVKAWKRRTTIRRARAVQVRQLADEA